jgi:isochorismate hydrolase
MTEPSQLIRREDSLLLVVDMQARVLAAIGHPPALVDRVAQMIAIAVLLEVPVVFTEHCGAKLGPVREDLRALAPDAPVLAKQHFSSLAEPAIASTISAFGRNQVILTGVEAHVCVMQTGMALQDLDYQTYLAADAVGARREQDHATAMTRLSAAGVVMVTVEMAAFEWLRRADTPAFKQVISVLK